MLRDLIRRIDEAHPGLARWLGDRLDLQLPAIGFSVLTHLVLLGTLGMVGYAAHNEVAREFRTEVVSTALEDFARLDATALAEVEKPTVMEPVAASMAPKLSPMLTEAPPRPSPPPPTELTEGQIAMSAGIVLPTAIHLGQTVTVRGSGMENVGGVEGAVDRLAVEILRHLEQGRTLVVWAFDASGSLYQERQNLAKYIDGVYAHIAAHEEGARASADGGLLTAVVAFGKDRKPMTPEPTADRETIARAIRDVPLDKSGVESTFQTVIDAVKKWGRYRPEGRAYKTMIVVVTDEIGDDEDKLEGAIASAEAAKVPVYVLGSAALFGRADGYADYTDPETKQTFRGLPVREGPESAQLEGIRLPFWFNGPQYDFLDAGFGPYALSRLAGATGGIYFVTRMGSRRVSFDPAGMREYRPDWVPRNQYVAAVEKHPIRLAITRAAMIAQQNLPGQPGLQFPAAETPEFKEAMKQNQDRVARAEYTINMALEPIAAVSKRRDHETSRRWQAHYDLIRGRLQAMYIRCHEYNAACARMLKDPKKFSNPDSNAWRLVPTDTIESGEKYQKIADEAKVLLKRVVTSHPGTPWALLAQRELKDPLGFKWVETKVPPPPKRNEAAEAAARKKMQRRPEPPKPAELPKL